jgi:hypothetical protein
MMPYIFLLPILVLSFSCPKSDCGIRDTGTVRYFNLEGGFYGIITDSGLRYRPLELPPQFQKDGLRVRFRGRAVKGVMGIQMWGVPFEIIDVQVLESHRD